MNFTSMRWVVSGLLVMSPLVLSAKHHHRSHSSNLTSTQEQMLNDLGFIHNLFHVSYAPLECKEIAHGFDLKKEIKSVQDVIKGNRSLTTKEFQYQIKSLCNSVKDYHVVAEFFSTESAVLPFCVQGAGGKYFISYIEPDLFEDSDPLFSVGDEIIEFDGKPIAEAIQDFRSQEIGHNFEGTDLAMAELYLTTRLGSLGHRAWEGPISMVYRRQGKPQLYQCDMKWSYTPELISSAPPIHLARSPKSKKAQLSRQTLYHKQFMTPHYAALKRVRRMNSHPSVMMGAKRSMMPPLGEILWQSPEESEFYAYLFKLPDGRTAGYLRIPTFSAGEDSAEDFSNIIQHFESHAEVLVIDQLNNPGGSVLYLYALLSMLSDRPLKLPMHRVKITQEDVFMAASEIPALSLVEDDDDAKEVIGETLAGLPVNCNIANSFLRAFCFMLDQWDSGKHYTDLHYHCGIEEVNPHPDVHFSKPILVLVNSLAFSAGDFFPAILQDNKRAKIMGTRTAGAGGYIEKISFPNLSGINEIDLTASYAVRPGGKPIEGFGVDPDIHYEVSQVDLQNNYSEYVARILDELQLIR